MNTAFALLCFVVVIHWLIFPYPPGLLHWHCGNLTIAPVPAKQPWWIWINTSCECIMNDCITTTKQSTTKPCAYFLGYTVCQFIQLLTKYYTPHKTTNEIAINEPISDTLYLGTRFGTFMIENWSRFIGGEMGNNHLCTCIRLINPFLVAIAEET